MKKILLLLFFTGVSFCFSVDLSTTENYGTLTIYRPKNFIGMAVDYEVMINQTIVSTYKMETHTTFKLDPGVYLIHTYSGTMNKEINILFSSYANYSFGVYKLTINPGDNLKYTLGPAGSGLSFKKVNDFDKESKEQEILRMVSHE